MRRPSALLLLFTALLLSACEAPRERAPATAETAPSNEIVVGLAGPLTGDLAEFGAQMKAGATKAVSDINAAGGLLGKRLKLEIGDDECDPKRAVRAANDLVAKGVVFVAGHFCSGSSIPASAVYHEQGILQITPASSNPRLTDDAAGSGWDTVFRTCGRDDLQGSFAGDWIAQHFRGKNVAVVDDGSVYGKYVAGKAQEALRGAGIVMALHETIPAGRSDYSSLVRDLGQANADVVFFGGYHPEAAVIVKQMRQQGVMAQFLGADALNTLEFATLAGKAADGVMFTNAAEARNLPSAAKVVEEFRNEGFEPEGYTLSTYAAIQVWAQAVAKAGTMDSERVAAALRSQDWDTVIGKLGFDAKGDLKQPALVWYVFKNGNYSEMR
jgi:branched-chain amino acid transport system substrate-binding protein